MAVGSGEVLLVADARVVADHWVLVVVVHDGVLPVLHAVRAGRPLEAAVHCRRRWDRRVTFCLL